MPRRRDYLAALPGALLPALAGCPGSPRESDRPTTDRGTTSASPTDRGTTSAPDGPAALPATGDPGDRLGAAVALDGTTALVGADADRDSVGDEGRGTAYVFSGRDGDWRRTAALAPPADTDVARFGHEVALAGDVALVAAERVASEGSDRGVAYAFERADGEWTRTATLAPPARGEGRSFFGASLAVAGATALVGATHADDQAGAVHVFERGDGSWTRRTVLRVGDERVGALGESVALAGGTAVLGAPGPHDTDWLGWAYVFAAAEGGWTERARLPAGEAASADRFGAAVAASGDRALVGAPRDFDRASHGTAALFERAGGEWTERARFAAPASAPDEGGDRFGTAVALAGALALVGHRGAVSVYERGDGGWTHARDLAPGDGGFGTWTYDLALADGTALVGDPAAGDDAGAVHVFDV